MNPITNGRLCTPGSTFKYVSSLDTAEKGILAKWKNERDKAKELPYDGGSKDSKNNS